MKKILSSIGTLLLIFCVITKVEAKSYSIILNGDNTFEEEITITLQINNQKEMSSYCNGICGLMATLKYDSTKLELIKVTELNDFEITYNSHDGTIIIERDSGVSDGTNIGTLKFRSKSLNNEESTTISLDNIIGTDGENDINTQKISKTIKYIKETINDESSKEDNKDSTNKDDNKETTNSNNASTNNNSNNTNKEELKKKSNNNYLSTLTIDSINFDFNKEKLIYDIIVEYDVSQIYVSAKQEDTNATIDGIGEHKLKVGKNSIKLTVKAENGTEREYVININREEKNIKIEEKEENNNITNSIAKDETNNPNYILYVIPVIVVLLIIGIILIFKRKKTN